MNLERNTVFYPAYDKRNTDPNKNYGICGASLLMTVKGERGAYQFKVSLPWYLPGSLSRNSECYHRTMDDYGIPTAMPTVDLGLDPLPLDVGYHAYEPQYEDQPCMGECELLGTDKCYYDGSSLHAYKVFGILVEKGSEGVFKYLEEIYCERFGSK